MITGENLVKGNSGHVTRETSARKRRGLRDVKLPLICGKRVKTRKEEERLKN